MDWDKTAARYRSIIRCEHGTVVEEDGHAYPCEECPDPGEEV